MIYFLAVLSILVLVHEFGHFIMARRAGVRVEVFSFGFGPKLFSLRRGDTEYAISLIPLGGYVKMAGDDPTEFKNEPHEFLAKSVGDRFKIIFAGPLLNYILAFLIFSVIFMFGSPTLTTEVGGLLKDYPAEKAGIKIGDKVVAVDGKKVKYWEDMVEIIHGRTEGAINISIARSGKIMDLPLRPVVRETKDIFGKKTSVALVGIAPSQAIEKVRYGFLQSLSMGFKKLLQLTYLTYKALWSIATGRLSLRESMTGPIGIFMVTGKAAKLGMIYLLHLMGILSASLAIFNLLPIPVLDGGHIIFLALEKIRRRTLSVKAQEIITNIGIAFLILLMLAVFYNDIINFQVAHKLVGIFKK